MVRSMMQQDGFVKALMGQDDAFEEVLRVTRE